MSITKFNYNVYHKTNYKPLFLEVEVEHTPSERGSREFGTGLQLEPDYADEVCVLSAVIKGVDVVDILVDNIIDDIKEYYLEDLKERNNDTAYFD
jgi:hypothetical protein